jgi:ketosteroid isomerase-like protein
MSPDNVETVRHYADAVFERQDVDGALGFVDPYAVFDWSESRAPYRGVRKGHAEIRKQLRDVMEAFAEINPEFEITALDSERVLFVNRLRVRGKASGVEVTAVGATLWTLRDGKIVHGKLFQSKDEALAAAGIEE